MSEEPIEHGKELGPPKNLATGVIKAIRPRQWVKNVLVLAAPLAAGQLTFGTATAEQVASGTNPAQVWENVGLAFVAFCLAASAIYLINDALDVEADRNHPTKRFRPIAAGVVPVNLAYVLFVIFAAGSIAVALLANWQTAVVIGIYLAIQETNVQRGKDFLNKIIALYNDRGIDQKNISAQRTASFLEERIALNSKELSDVEHYIEKFKKENNITDIEVEAKILIEKNGDFKEKLIDSEIQYATVQLIEDFLKAPENRYAMAPLNLGITEKTAAEGLQQYNNFLLEREKLLQTTKGDNPAVLMLNKQIDLLRENVLETFKSIKAGFDVARNDLKKQEREFISRIGDMPTQERLYLDIKRQQVIKSELYLFLLQQKEENAMTIARSMPRAQIIDAAYSLLDPVKPNPLFVFSIALIIAFFIPVIVIAYKVLVKN